MISKQGFSEDAMLIVNGDSYDMHKFYDMFGELIGAMTFVTCKCYLIEFNNKALSFEHIWFSMMILKYFLKRGLSTVMIGNHI